MSNTENQHGGRRDGAGRPKSEAPLSERVMFRCTPEEKEMISAQIKSGVKIRNIVLEGLSNES